MEERPRNNSGRPSSGRPSSDRPARGGRTERALSLIHI